MTNLSLTHWNRAVTFHLGTFYGALPLSHQNFLCRCFNTFGTDNMAVTTLYHTVVTFLLGTTLTHHWYWQYQRLLWKSEKNLEQNILKSLVQIILVYYNLALKEKMSTKIMNQIQNLNKSCHGDSALDHSQCLTVKEKTCWVYQK